MKTRVLHLSPTPLVGAPANLVDSLNNYTDVEALLVVEKDYPGKLKGCFSKPEQLLARRSQCEMEELIASSTMIHIHNFLSKDLLGMVLKCAKAGCKFIYHVHSPLREGPLFVSWEKYSGLSWYKRVVVGQYHPRIYQDYIPLPNLITKRQIEVPVELSTVPSLLFSPSHNRGGRWNSKSPSIQGVLDRLDRDGHIIDLTSKDFLLPEVLYARRCSSDISIDEISTGGFHQVSMEGLSAGNVVINGADSFSRYVLMTWSKSEEEPPFYICCEENFEKRLLELCADREMLMEFKGKSVDFFRKYLKPENLVGLYVDMYKG